METKNNPKNTGVKDLIIAVLVILFFVMLINYKTLVPLIIGLSIEQWRLIKEFFAILISWPVAVILLGLIFMYKFSEAIKKFLGNSNFFKAGPFEMGQTQSANTSENIDNEITENLEQKGVTLTPEQIQGIESELRSLTEENDNRASTIADKDKLIEYLAERTEIFEFAYLNLHLVTNSKNALLWFYNTAAIKEYFMTSYQLPAGIPDPIAEKNAILNALIVADLLGQINGVFSVSDKGKRFLNYIGYLR